MRETKMSKKNVSIRSTIIIVFIILMLTTVSIIGYIVFSNWLSSTDKTITKMAEDMNMEILNQVDAFINIPLVINEVNHGLIENGIVDIFNDKERENFFVGVLRTHTNDVYSFSYGSEDGEYYGARRNATNEIEIMRNNADTNGNSWYYSVREDMTAGDIVVEAGKFDPRTRDWYKIAKEKRKPVFSPIYKHFVMEDLTVSAAYPIYNKQGKLQGILGTHITLSIINNYLKDIVEHENSIAMIIEKNSGDLIANSYDEENFKTLEDGSLKRFTINDVKNHTILKAYEQYLSTEESNFRIKDGNESLYMNLTEYNKEGLEWLVITGVPENLFMSDIMDNIKLTLLLTILALLLSIVIYLYLTNKFLKPIDNLIDTTEKFSSGDLYQRTIITRNDEIGRISKSFNKMADTIYMLVNNLEAKVEERTTELSEINNILKENKDKLQLILNSTAEAIYGIDKYGNCTFCNISCLQMLGYKHPKDLIGKNMHYLIHHNYRDGTPMTIDSCKVNKALKLGKGTRVNDEVFWKEDGTSFDVEYYSYPQYKDGEIIGAVVTFMDITERKIAEGKIKYLSYHDSLTGLYNRMFFEEELRRLDIERNLPISIIVGDVNGLKLTNDIFGHSAGDILLKKVADIFKKVCRADDIISRVGGDEFVVLLPDTGEDEAEKIILRVKKELAKEHIIAIKGSISMGSYTKDNKDQDINRIMENAEDIMYKDKTLNHKSISTNQIKTIIGTLHAINIKEEEHSRNVSELSQKIGRAMNLNNEEIRRLYDVGYLHDIGKIVVDRDILNKDEAEMTEEEIKKFRQHSVVGYRILNSFDHTLDLAELVLTHHESWDGSGYPKGLMGEEIPKLARIIAVAEEYDKLTYGMKDNNLSKEQALEEIKKQSGIKFDPKIVNILTKLILVR